MINCVGSMFGSSGYDNHFRYLVNALNKLTDCKIITNLPNGWQRDVNDQELEMIKREQDLDINLIICNPVHWRVNCSAKRNICYLIWEGDKIPKWMIKECLNPAIEKIICPSTHTLNAVKKTLLKTPIVGMALLNKLVKIPHGVDLETFYPINQPKFQDKKHDTGHDSQRKKDKDDGSNVSLSGDTNQTQGQTIKDEHMPIDEENHADTFTFLMNKGLRNLEDRGGLQYGLRAFLEEFTDKDNTELILKINPAYGIPNLLEMFPELKNKGIPKITYIHENYTKKQLNKLYNSADVFVSPTRAEAFNLPCLEAMSCGVPVITTNYGGQKDFVNNENGWLIDYSITEVKHEIEYEGISWSIPDHNHLKKLLRYVFEHQDEVKQKGKLAIKTAKSLTWDNAAKQIHSLL